MITPNHESSSFGAMLKAFRTRRHLTQRQLAEALGVHRHAILRWEQGDVLPAHKTLVLELARCLHLDEQETRLLLEASFTALSPHWYVPLPRNPFFTGREEILAALHTQLGVDQTVALTQSSALHGLGGVGKTQIALEYAYRHALEYRAVFWIGAETEEQIVASLLHIAETLQLPEREDNDQQRVVAAVQRWLISHGQWLLIWDNVEDLTLLERFLPSTRSGAILLTTRCQALGTLARSLDLLPMEQEEGMLFLLRRAKLLPPEAASEQMRQLATRVPAQYTTASELVTVLGGLPLALDQAGAYVEETHCGLLAYLDLFRTRRAVLLQQRGERSRDHPEPVFTTFTLAITTIAQCAPAVRDLLLVCALLRPDAIPEKIFCQGGEHLGAQLQATCGDALEWDRVLGVACAYSLLSRRPEEQTLSMHRLVQAVLLDTMTEAEQEQWNRRIIAALGAVFPEMEYAAESAVWKQCEHLLPHVLLSLHRDGGTSESLTCAALDYKTASYLLQRGQLIEAEPLFQRALQTREQVLGPEHPEVAASLNKLAILSLNQGRYTEAEPLLQRALQIREQALGPEHPEVAASLNNLAVLSWMQGKYAEAEPLYQRALQIWEQTLGLEHPKAAASLNNLAVLSWVQGKYAEAEPLFQRALQIREQALGPEHPEVAESLHMFANLFRDLGKYAEAEPLYQRALQIREQALGPECFTVADVLNDLAVCYQEQSRYEQAEALYQRALHIWEQTQGPGHPDMALSLTNLGNLSFEQGQYPEAESLYRKAFHIWEQALEPDHPYLAEPLTGLANLYREQGRYVEAEAFYHRALSIREHRLGSQHPETAKTLHDLAHLCQKQGNLKEAISLAERALQIRSRSLGDAHPKTIATHTLYTQLLQEPSCMQETAPSEHHAPEASDSREAERPFHDPSSSEHDPLQAFLDACCELHPRAWCRSADLWRAYTCWVEEHQERYPLSRGAFAAQLKVHGCRTDRTKSARLWRGLALVHKER